MLTNFAAPSRLGLRTLLVIDRATGETERIAETDPNFGASIAYAAEYLGLSPVEAAGRLLAGEELATSGFLRKVV